MAAALLDQEPPFEHDIFGNRENALFEHRPHLVRQPIVEFSTAIGVSGSNPPLQPELAQTSNSRRTKNPYFKGVFVILAQNLAHKNLG